MAKINSATLDDLLKQAKTTNRLLAAQLKDKMTQKDLVKLLNGIGLTYQELAEVLDTTAATINVTVQRLKKKVEKPKSVTAPVTAGSADKAGDNG